MFHLVLLGAAFSILIGWLAYKYQALTSSGAIGAIIIGTVVFACTQIPGSALMLAFFVSSSIISRLYTKGKTEHTETNYAKASPRDINQALANGGAAAMAAIIYWLTQKDWAWGALVAALATANADTWASELGTFSSKHPRLITTGKPVEHGTSGGITLSGSLAAVGGATCIASIAAMLHSGERPILPLVLICTISGITGTFFDSLLGATVQKMYHCTVCAKDTESYPLHSCGSNTVWSRGSRWLNNNWVNFLATVLAALMAASGLLFFTWT